MKDEHEYNRINSMEASHNELVRIVTSLTADVSGLASTVEGIVNSVKDLSDAVKNNNRTNWGVLGTWAAVIISLMSVLGILSVSPLIRTQNEISARQEKLFDRNYELVQEIAYLKAKYDVNQKYLDRQNDDLKKELRSLLIKETK